jgi:hypothetical protein
MVERTHDTVGGKYEMAIVATSQSGKVQAYPLKLNTKGDSVVEACHNTLLGTYHNNDTGNKFYTTTTIEYTGKKNFIVMKDVFPDQGNIDLDAWIDCVKGNIHFIDKPFSSTVFNSWYGGEGQDCRGQYLS